MLKEKNKSAFKICFKASKVMSILYISLFVVQGLIPSILTIIEARFINEILSVYNSGVINTVLLINGIIVLLLIAMKWEIGSMQQLVSNLMLSKVKMQVNSQVFEKKSKIQYTCFEDNQINDLIFMSSNKAENKIVKCFKNELMLLSDIITVISFIIVLYPILSLKIWVLLLLVIPLLKMSVKSGEKAYQTNKALLTQRRQSEILYEILTNKAAVYERTTFDYSNELNQRNYQLNETMRHKELRVKLKWFIRLKSSAIIIAILTAVLTFDMFYSVISGALTMGMFIAMFGALNSLIGKMTWQITELTDEIAKDNAFLKDFNAFFRLPEQEMNNDEKTPFEYTEFEYIELKDVSFKYPNSDDYALKNFSYTFRKGVNYSLIGVNGSGKSTLIKLLLGLYDDYSGTIKINGINSREIFQEDLHNVFSIVFQDFAKYQLSVDEIMSLVDAEKNNDKDHIFQIMDFASVLDSLPEGSRSKIGKIYEENLELSYGQWQKINIVKSLIKSAAVYILDEPTASLDPISELDIYNKYMRIKNQDTLILISHRLGITKNSDTIILIDCGQLVTAGTHDELYHKCNLYKEMYDLQKDWYNYDYR